MNEIGESRVVASVKESVSNGLEATKEFISGGGESEVDAHPKCLPVCYELYWLNSLYNEVSLAETREELKLTASTKSCGFGNEDEFLRDLLGKFYPIYQFLKCLLEASGMKWIFVLLIGAFGPGIVYAAAGIGAAGPIAGGWFTTIQAILTKGAILKGTILSGLQSAAMGGLGAIPNLLAGSFGSMFGGGFSWTEIKKCF